jgi:uncharacterized glyoxalase superfamily protein PhnB
VRHLEGATPSAAPLRLAAMTLQGRVLGGRDSVPGIRWVQVAPKEGTTALTLVTWFESMPPGSLQGLVLRSSNLQTDYEQLVAKGVEFDGPPQQQPWATEAVLHDPDGNSLVLQQA